MTPSLFIPRVLEGEEDRGCVSPFIIQERDSQAQPALGSEDGDTEWESEEQMESEERGRESEME